MATCRAIITRAMRWPGVLEAGESAEADDATDHLGSLQAMYLDLIDTGSNLTNVLVTAAYTAGENVRIAYSGATTAAITLPTTIADPAVTSLTHPPVDNDNRQPEDYTVAVVAGSTPAVWCYDANLGDWVNLNGLALTDQAPWSTFMAQGLSAMLAVFVADEHGRQVPPGCKALAGEARSRFITKLQMSDSDEGSAFFQPDFRRQNRFGETA